MKKKKFILLVKLHVNIRAPSQVFKKLDKKSVATEYKIICITLNRVFSCTIQGGRTTNYLEGLSTNYLEGLSTNYLEGHRPTIRRTLTNYLEGRLTNYLERRTTNHLEERTANYQEG